MENGRGAPATVGKEPTGGLILFSRDQSSLPSEYQETPKKHQDCSLLTLAVCLGRVALKVGMVLVSVVGIKTG